jgi:hypothetical protein
VSKNRFRPEHERIAQQMRVLDVMLVCSCDRCEDLVRTALHSYEEMCHAGKTDFGRRFNKLRRLRENLRQHRSYIRHKRPK